MGEKKKLCVVSGASGDIGVAICRQLLEAEYRVIAIYGRNAKPLDALSDHTADLLPVSCPFGDPLVTQSALKETLKPYKSIDALVCCAGTTIRKPAMLTGASEIADLMSINFMSAVSLTQLVLRRMIAQGAGAIVYVGSRAGTYGLAGQAAYAATKGAIASYAMSLAQEVGPKNITVNVIAPGAVQNLVNPKYSAEEDEIVRSMIALRRLAEPSEIAELAALLVSRRVSYVTGAIIPIDGGARF